MNQPLNDTLKQIKLILADVDGTLTDGSIILIDGGIEAKCFTARDGFASNHWVRSGGKFAIITGRPECECVSRRAKEMKADRIIFSSKDKSSDVLSLCEEFGITRKETAYIGDDIPDLPALRIVGLPVVVSDAADEAKQLSAIVTKTMGGKGALRELVEIIMKAQGTWDAFV